MMINRRGVRTTSFAEAVEIVEVVILAEMEPFVTLCKVLSKAWVVTAVVTPVAIPEPVELKGHQLEVRVSQE